MRRLRRSGTATDYEGARHAAGSRRSRGLSWLTLRAIRTSSPGPGEFLVEIVIPATGRGKTEIARLMGVSPQTLYDIPRQRHAVTPAIAMRLGKLFGNGPGIWLRMQTEDDLWHAARIADVSRIETIKSAA